MTLLSLIAVSHHVKRVCNTGAINPSGLPLLDSRPILPEAAASILPASILILPGAAPISGRDDGNPSVPAPYPGDASASGERASDRASRAAWITALSALSRISPPDFAVRPSLARF